MQQVLVSSLIQMWYYDTAKFVGNPKWHFFVLLFTSGCTLLFCRFWPPQQLQRNSKPQQVDEVPSSHMTRQPVHAASALGCPHWTLR